MEIPGTTLSGQLLIAMPDMGGGSFARSVVYLCAHSEDGALGLIVNKPTPEIRFRDLLEQIGIPVGGSVRDIRVHFGGPVEQAARLRAALAGLYRGRGDARGRRQRLDDGQRRRPAGDRARRGTRELDDGARLCRLGPGPARKRDRPERLADRAGAVDIVFGRANEHKWSAALKSLGIDPLTLSSSAGRA